MYLPVSHTCFFTLDLPRWVGRCLLDYTYMMYLKVHNTYMMDWLRISYTNEATMREKLLYAIYHCTAIDGDDTSLGLR